MRRRWPAPRNLRAGGPPGLPQLRVSHFRLVGRLPEATAHSTNFVQLWAVWVGKAASVGQLTDNLIMRNG
jgi:hypothetical protein